MKLPPLTYVAARSVAGAVDALAEHREDAAVLAGGQSLLLEMRTGERAPRVLVGLDRVPGLADLHLADGALVVGSLVRHARLEHGAAAAAGPLGRLVQRVAPFVAHPPIRSRGTFVGSLAWGHPSAEWCALAALVDAELQVVRVEDSRQVVASDWFRGDRRTDRRPDELVTAVRLPLLPATCGVGFVEHRRTHGSFAMVAALAAVDLHEDGTLRYVRVALAGAGEVPLRATAAEAALAGRRPDPASLAEAAALAAAASDPVGEPHCSADYRRHAVGVVAGRALAAATADAEREAA